MTMLMVVSACSFSNTVTSEREPDAIDVKGDEGGEGMNVAKCSAPDASGLVVCFEFEDSASDGVLDDSSPARRHATTAGAMQVSSAVPARGMVLDVGPDASTYVAQTTALDLSAGYTLAAWVKPETLPADGTARGVLDHEGQYAMIVSVTSGGFVHNRCQHTGVSKYEYTTRLPVNAWSFMACTWNGTQLCAYRWASVTDHEHYCHTPTIAPSANGTRGLAVGHLSDGGLPHARFDGAIDSVTVYSRGMSDAQLCAMIGQPAGCMPCDGVCL